MCDVGTSTVDRLVRKQYFRVSIFISVRSSFQDLCVRGCLFVCLFASFTIHGIITVSFPLIFHFEAGNLFACTLFIVKGNHMLEVVCD